MVTRFDIDRRAARTPSRSLPAELGRPPPRAEVLVADRGRAAGAVVLRRGPRPRLHRPPGRAGRPRRRRRLRPHRRTLVRDLCLFADKIDPAAVADDGLVTLLPGERRRSGSAACRPAGSATARRAGAAHRQRPRRGSVRWARPSCSSVTASPTASAGRTRAASAAATSTWSRPGCADRGDDADRAQHRRRRHRVAHLQGAGRPTRSTTPRRAVRLHRSQRHAGRVLPGAADTAGAVRGALHRRARAGGGGGRAADRCWSSRSTSTPRRRPRRGSGATRSRAGPRPQTAGRPGARRAVRCGVRPAAGRLDAAVEERGPAVVAPDGVHPSAFGHRLIADRWLGRLDALTAPGR